MQNAPETNVRWLENKHLSFSCCRIIRTILTSTLYSSTNSIDLLILNLPARPPLFSRPPGVSDDDTHPQSSGPEETPAIRSARAWLSSFTRKRWKLCKFVDHRGSKSPPRKRGEYYSEAVPGWRNKSSEILQRLDGYRIQGTG